MTGQPRRGRGPAGGRFVPTTRPEATGLHLTDELLIDPAEQKREERLPRTIAELGMLCEDAAKLAARGRTSFDTDWIAKRAGKNIVTELQETLSRLPVSYQDGHQDVEWSLIRGMRNRVVHEYQDADDEAVWKVISLEIPQMRKQLGI